MKNDLLTFIVIVVVVVVVVFVVVVVGGGGGGGRFTATERIQKSATQLVKTLSMQKVVEVGGS